MLVCPLLVNCMQVKVVHTKDSAFFWLVRGKSLLRVAGEKWQEEAILKAPDLALGSSDKSLFIGRGNAVLHYAWSGHLTQAIKGPRGHLHKGVRADVTINRQDFGVKFMKKLPTGGLIVGNDVKITLDLELLEK